jgi:hypothetical protein
MRKLFIALILLSLAAAPAFAGPLAGASGGVHASAGSPIGK